ncbi:hypothetical protein AB0K38_11145, partial [Streptomyces griseoincarnatus]
HLHQRHGSLVRCGPHLDLTGVTRSVVPLKTLTVPGDDGEDDLLEDDHPDMSVLLIVTAPAEAQLLSTELAAVDGLTRLRTSRS